jgi:betaine-aldehyde dehydrogenase
MTVTYPLDNLIAGDSVPGGSGTELEVVNPSTGAAIAVLREATAEQVDAAVRAARRAQRDWARTTPGARGEALHAIAALLADRIDEFAELESIDAGKPITTARTVEMPGIVAGLRYFAGAGRLSSVLATDEYVAGNTIMMRREPVGVVAAITPWNFPLQQAIWKIGPALATGNTVVVKPAELAPLSTARFVALANEVLPPGVLNIVHGRGATVGEELVRHPDVALVSFTGSTRAGQHIAQLAAAGPKRVLLELGGNAPVLVFDDADLDRLVPTLATAVLFNAGQECMSGNRILAGERVRDALVERLAAAMGEWQLGDAADPATTLGPLISQAHQHSVRSAVSARPRQTRLVLGGDAPDRPGYFFNPTLITDIEQTDPLVQREVFGPVATVQPFRDEDQAVAYANGTNYGLAASVWTADGARGLRIARDLNFGSVWVNNHFVLGPEVPQGGFGASGYGKEGGLAGVDEMTRLKQVSVRLD